MTHREGSVARGGAHKAWNTRWLRFCAVLTPVVKSRHCQLIEADRGNGRDASMRRLVCVKQTCPLAVSDRPLSPSCMVGVLAFNVLNVSSGVAAAIDVGPPDVPSCLRCGRLCHGWFLFYDTSSSAFTCSLSDLQEGSCDRTPFKSEERTNPRSRGYPALRDIFHVGCVSYHARSIPSASHTLP